jgi:hypothetical protein
LGQLKSRVTIQEEWHELKPPTAGNKYIMVAMGSHTCGPVVTQRAARLQCW